MGRTILIVDDSKIERVVLNGYLKADYDLIEAASGEEAIGILRAQWQRISAIVMDVVMPGMNGFEALKTIKANAQWHSIPVVIATGLDDEDSREKAVALGADNFVIKPFNRNLLLHVVGSAVQLRDMAAMANEIMRDSLTGLLSSGTFYTEAERMIRRHEPGYFTLTCLNIENFKVINDQYGTETGNAVLIHIAQTLGSFIGSIKGLCGRYMADKFALLYPTEMKDSEILVKNYAEAAAPKCIRQPIRIRIGRYLVNDTTLPVSTMFDRASMAEAMVKGRYDTFIGEYNEKMRDDLLREQQMVVDMVGALENGEFEPWFQPQYNHATGELIGAEALVRWRRDGKIIPPNEFIPVFEKNGFIYEVDKSIWRQVCAYLRRWIDEGRGPLPVSVNISRYDLLQSDFMETICALVKEYELSVELLRLEITESAFSENTKVITGMVGQLIERGFTVEIDDFGSGYSSLNTLKDVPASILKLDMRFFEATENSERGGNIVESVVRMAKWLGMAVIAEGVEDKAQADYLKTIGCYYIQGYYYARPMPADSYEAEMEKSAKETKLSLLETLDTLDSNLFWDPKSMETLIFNSYAGGACIFEAHDNATELLRVNDQYVGEMHGLIPKGAQLKDSSIAVFIDDEGRKTVKNTLRTARQTGRSTSCEVRLTDGKQVEYIRYTVRMIAQTNERRLYYAVIVNITEQRKAEQSAMNNAERISAIMDNTKCGITAFVISPDGEMQPLFINNRFYELLGYTKEQFAHEVKVPFDCIWHEDREEVVHRTVGLQQVGLSTAMQFRAVRRDGRLIWLRVDMAIVKFANIPQPVQLGNFLDVTEQVETEQKRIEAAQQLQVIMGNVNGSVSAFLMDEMGNTTPIFCNEKYYEIYGYTKEQAEAIHLDVMSCILPEDFSEVTDKLNKLKNDGVPIDIDYRAKKRDGRIIYVRCIASRMSMDGYGDEVIVAVGTDFTEQHTLQDQLRAVIENINGGVSAVQMRGNMPVFLLVNESYFDIIGYTKEQFYSEIENAFDIIHPDDRERIKKLFRDAGTDEKRYTMEYRIVRRNGAVRHVLCNTTVMRLFGVEEPVQLSVLNDITTLRKAQQKERDVSTQMQAVMENLHGGVSASVLHGENNIEIVFANDGFYKLFGYTKEQFEAEVANPTDPILPEDRHRIMSTVVRIVREHGSDTYEYRCRRRDGSVVWIQTTNAVISIAGVGDAVLLAVTTDVTALRRAEEQRLEAADRLSAVMNAMTNGITAVTIRERMQFLFANDCYYKMHGIRHENGERDTLRDAFSMLHPDDRQRIRDTVTSMTQVGQSAEAEYRVNLPDGTTRFVKTQITVTSLIGVDAPVQVAIYTDITDEKKASEQLRFLNESASDILSQPDSEKAINDTLEKLLHYFAGERSYIFELDDAKRIADNTYEICADGVTPEAEYLQDIPYETQQTWFDAFDKTGFIAIPEVEAIDEGERAIREMLLAQSIHSIIVAPLWRDGKLIGYMGVDNPTMAVDQVSQLIALADYIAVLLTRRDLMKSVEHERQSMQTFMDDMPGGFLRMRMLDGKHPTIISFNEGFGRMLGMTADEVVSAYGDDAFKCLATEDAGAAAEKTAEAYAEKGRYTAKCRLKTKGGDCIWAQVFGRFVKDENGELFLNAYFTDITEQKNAEQHQIELLDNMPNGAALFEYDGKDIKVIHINKRYWELVGREAVDYSSESPFGAIHPDDRAIVAQEIEAAIRNCRDAAVDCRLLCGDGGYRPFHISAKTEEKDGGGHLLYATYAPVSDETMSIQEMLPIALSTMVSSTDDLSYVKDKELRYICASQSIADLAGVKNPRDFIGKTAAEVFSKAFADKFDTDDGHVIATGEAVINALEQISTKDGAASLVRTSKFPILDANGSAIGVYCISRDITAQKEKESQLELLTSSIPGGLAAYSVLNEGFATLYFNDGYFAFSGYTREEYKAMTDREPLALIFEEDRPRLLAMVRGFAQKKRDGMTGSCTYRCKTKSGGMRWMSMKAVLSQVGADAYILNAVQLDVTEMREADEQLKLLTDSIPGGIATFRCRPGNVDTVCFNDGVCALAGYSREEIETQAIPILDMILDEDRPIIHEQIERLMAGETKLDFTLRIRAKDKIKWVNGVARTTGHADGVYDVSAVLTDVTAQQEERERSCLANEEYRVATLHSNCTICRYSIAAKTLTVASDAAKRLELPELMSGVPYECVKQGIISEETKDSYIALFEGIMGGKKESTAIYRRLLSIGWRWIEAHATTVFGADGEPFSAIISYIDITEQREKEAIYSRWQNSVAQRPKDSYTMLRCNLTRNKTFDSREGDLLTIDFDLYANSLDERTEAYIGQCVYADDRERFRAFLRTDTVLAEYYRGRRTDSIEYRENTQNGKTRWLRLSIDLVEYPYSPDVQAYLMFENIDERKRAQQKIIERAETDSLTGVLNRATFAVRANQIMSESKPSAKHALLMIDIDGFKQVNDVFGHGAGDRTLCEIADVLTRSSRKEDLVGRLGGDEFVVFITAIPNEIIAAKIAQQLLELIRKDLGMDVRISASIGVAVFPQDGKGFEALYKAADNVLYRVKDSGKNGYAFVNGNPVLDAASPRQQKASKNEDQRRLRRILIADDSNADMEMLIGLFRKDFRVEKATDGATALTKLRHYGTAISVVLLDLNMPGMDGYEVLRKMKHDETTRTVPVIVLSSDADRETALSVIRAGADDLVSKPVDQDILKARVEAAINRSENERKRAQDSYLSLRHTEVNSYKSALERSGIMVITLEWGKNEFGYSPSVSARLAGEYDGKVFWRVLLSSMVTDVQTVQKMQQLVHSVADDRARTEGDMTVKLKTASGVFRLFEMNVFKETNDYGIADKMIITLKEMA